MKNIKRFFRMLGPLSVWMLIPGGFSLYEVVTQQWGSAIINGLFLAFMLGHNYYNNRKLYGIVAQRQRR